MGVHVYLTTAEHVVAATDAALQLPSGINEQVVIDFLNVPATAARNALRMAEELGFVARRQGKYWPDSRFAAYLVTNERTRKAAVLRLFLEQYEAYRVFKARLRITGLVGDAAVQTKALLGIPEHRETIVATFTSLGTYAGSLVAEGAGLFRVTESEGASFLELVDEVVADRDRAEVEVRKLLGDEAAAWVSPAEVLDHLVTAYNRLESVVETRAPVVHAGNAVESLLLQFGNAVAHSVALKNGINAKAEDLAQAKKLPKKHLNMTKYLGHVRNAADHGIDPDTGKTWVITRRTSIEFVHVAVSLCRNIVSLANGRYEL